MKAALALLELVSLACVSRDLTPIGNHDPNEAPNPIWGSYRYVQGERGRRGRENVWSNEAQGIAHDERSWYISSASAIYRYAGDADLTSDDCEAVVPGPEDCEHVGDIDLRRGELYAPLEECGKHRPNRICVLDAATLLTKRCAVVPADAQEKLPWVAVDPGSGNIYSASSDDDGVNVYAADFAPGGTLQLIDRIPLDRVYHRLQGGELTQNGRRLYLVSDDDADPLAAGIHVFDIVDGAAQRVAFIPAQARIGTGGLEMEGLTVWDRGREGHIHWILLDNGNVFDDDDIYVKHVTVDLPGRL